MTVSLKAQAWREEFRGCLDCWENQVDTEEDLDNCDSAGSRHYVKPWTYVPGAKSTFFNSFMKSCLDWAKANPGTPYPACENLDVTPDDYEYCPNGEIFFTAQNGNGAYIVGADCGEIIGVMLWTAPADTSGCPEETKVYFADADGRKGCAYLVKKDENECCCEINPEVGIEFTSLQMSCGESQELGIDPEVPGCPPYAWALEGGGSLSDTEGLTVTYTAPEVNPGCANNPTITVTDSCGNSNSVRFAVNCLGQNLAAYYVVGYEQEGIATVCFNLGGLGVNYCMCGFSKHGTNYKCDGSFFYAEPYSPNPFSIYFRIYKDPSSWIPGLGDNCPNVTCNESLPPEIRYTIGCVEEDGDDPGGTAVDIRTEWMIEHECCPINPFTGLPF